MEEERKDDRLRRARRLLYFALPLLLYTATVIPLALGSLDRINPDAVSYIRRGLYISRGDFVHSLSGYWSPLISWCIAPLIKFGMDGLHAARLISCLWGAIWLMAVAIFFDRFTSIHRLWKTCALLVLALYIAQIAARQITPDVMLAACLLFYLSITLAPNFLRRPWLQFVAGLMGGFSYLAKAYALPFVLVHLPMTILIRSWLDNDAEKPRPGMILPLARGLVGIAIFSLPWIAANSWRFGHLTISTAGSHTHTDIGPPEVQNKIPSFFGLVPDPYINRHETKDETAYPTWSPFQSRKYFFYQLRIAGQHTLAIARSVGLFDRFYLSAIAGLIALLALFNLLHIDFAKWKILWLLLSAGIFGGGMLFVFFISRHLVALWPPLCLALALSIALNITRAPAFVRSLFAFAILVSFGIAAIANLRNTEGKPPAYRQLAAALHQHNIHGPLASADRHQGMFISFFADEKFIGFPPDQTSEAAEQKLLDQKPAALLVFKTKKIPKDMQQASHLASQIVQSRHWRLAFEFPVLPKQPVEVYIPTESR